MGKCNEISKPTVDNTALACDELIGTNCLVTTDAYNFFGIGIGNTLTVALTKITAKVKAIYNSLVIAQTNIATNTADIAALIPNVIIEGSLTLSSAQILDINTTPITLIPSPGVGKMIDLVSAVVRVNFNTVAFDVVDDRFILQFTGAETYISIVDDIVNGVVTKTYKFNTQDLIAGANQMVENAPVIATLATGNPTVGDGSIDIHYAYRIITL